MSSCYVLSMSVRSVKFLRIFSRVVSQVCSISPATITAEIRKICLQTRFTLPRCYRWREGVWLNQARCYGYILLWQQRRPRNRFCVLRTEPLSGWHPVYLFCHQRIRLFSLNFLPVIDWIMFPSEKSLLTSWLCLERVIRRYTLQNLLYTTSSVIFSRISNSETQTRCPTLERFIISSWSLLRFQFGAR